MTDQEQGQAGPQGRDRLAHHRDEDDLAIAEEGRVDQLRGRTVEGRLGEIPGGSDTVLQTNRRKNTMSRGKKMIRMKEAKK